MRRWLTGEPTLGEMLADPVIQLVMRRDRVDPDNLQALLRDISTRLPNPAVRPRREYRASTKSTGM